MVDSRSTQRSKFTIAGRGTEVIDGRTHYAISDMPPVGRRPPHFIAGKTLRWAGTHLMEDSQSIKATVKKGRLY